jgi:hypothetical protein
MTTKLLPRLEQFTDYALYGDDEKRRVAIAHIEEAGIAAFLNAVPGYHSCQSNGERLIGWCASRGVPMSCWNLVVGYRDLIEDGLLEAAPPVTAPVVDKWASVTVSRTDALAEYVQPDEEAEQLAKLVDDPNLNDHQRKARLRKLALLAGQQRRQFSESRRADDRDPQIVI